MNPVNAARARAFRAYLGPLWTTDWFVYAKRPFAGAGDRLRQGSSVPKAEAIGTTSAPPRSPSVVRSASTEPDQQEKDGGHRNGRRNHNRSRHALDLYIVLLSNDEGPCPNGHRC